jgi:hypothetical protein
MREYLQVRLLEGLQSAGASADLVFHGGTALRLLYRTPRFSEDLDFAVLRVDTPFDLVWYLPEAGRNQCASAAAPLTTAIGLPEQQTGGSIGTVSAPEVLPSISYT